jgi:hypothetical protein
VSWTCRPSHLPWHYGDDVIPLVNRSGVVSAKVLGPSAKATLKRNAHVRPTAWCTGILSWLVYPFVELKTEAAIASLVLLSCGRRSRLPRAPASEFTEAPGSRDAGGHARQAAPAPTYQRYRHALGHVRGLEIGVELQSVQVVDELLDREPLRVLLGHASL